MQDPSDLYADLGFAVFERIADRVFKPVGRVPDWWSAVGSLAPPGNVFVPSSRDSFLQSFLEEADELWSEPPAPFVRRSSPIWELRHGDQPCFVQVVALRRGNSDLLVFHDVEATSEGLRSQLQAGRNSQLELMRDIARRQQLELELRRAHHASEKLIQTRDTLLANVSHELRTPLTSILAMVDLLQASDDRDKQSELGAVIERSARGLLRLVNDILDMSKHEAGTVELEYQDVRVSEFVDSLRADFSAAARQKGIEFVVSLESAVPPTIQQDPLRLRQVLNNLIDNAIRFTESGSVTVTVRLEDQTPQQLLFEVVDTGVGIPLDQHQVIFDAFAQVDSSPSREYSGTGLGLAIANKLVTLLGGRLRLESEPGMGSTFRFAIPLQAPEAEMTIERNGEVEAVDDGDLDGIIVLVAEDNVVNRSYIRHVAEQAKASVLEADNGKQVLQLLDEHKVDVVVMDCQMPVLDGLAVTEMIRRAELQVGGHLPIVAVTAHAMKRDIDRCSEVGMDEHLSKPFTAAELRCAIRRALKSHSATVAGALNEALAKKYS